MLVWEITLEAYGEDSTHLGSYFTRSDAINRVKEYIFGYDSGVEDPEAFFNEGLDLDDGSVRWLWNSDTFIDMEPVNIPETNKNRVKVTTYCQNGRRTF
jgi:hypothetical protein